jgi:hypothetical protein
MVVSAQAGGGGLFSKGLKAGVFPPSLGLDYKYLLHARHPQLILISRPRRLNNPSLHHCLCGFA